MRMIVPMPITDTTLDSSNLSEDDTHSAWSSGTTYAAADYAYDATEHLIYKSVQGSNLNHDPTTDDGTWWVQYSATNKWKAFDSNVGALTVGTGDIEYTVTADRKCTHIALFGVDAAEVTVVVKDEVAATVHTETQAVSDDSEFVDWYTYFSEEMGYETELLFEDLPIYPGYDVEITIGDGTGATAVGEIIIGRNYILGITLDGTEVGFRDFSVKEQNDFGTLTITERGYADTAEFQFSLPTTDVRRVKRILTTNRATPCVFWSDTDMLDTGTFIYGFYDDMGFPLSAGGTTFATLDIKGLT